MNDYIAALNAQPKAFTWTAKAATIMEKIRRARNALNKMQSAWDTTPEAPHPGRTFVITTANGGGKDIYIQSATLDAKPLNKLWLSERTVFRGGTWNVVAGKLPNKNWGTARGAAPPSLSKKA